MKIINLFKKLGFLILLLTFVSTAAFAQTYVNNTNGDDLNGDGTATNPYKTIGQAITVTAAGGTISVASDVYGEATVNVTKALTFVATTFNSLSTVTITNGLTINTAGAADVVSFGVTGQKFNLGTSATALTLTKGNLQITGANVILGSGATITRTAGTLDNNPTTTNVNVKYTGTADLTSGGELPGALGSGALTVNITAGKKLTVGHGLTTTGGVTVTTGNLDVTGNLGLSTSNFTNTPAGNTVTVNGTIDFSTGKLINQNTGSVTVTGTATWTSAANIGNAVDNQANGNLSLNGAVNFTGTGTYTGTIRNNGTGTLTFAQGFTTSPATGKTITIAATNNSSGKLTFNGAASIGALTNNLGTVTLTGGTVSGTVANNTAAGTIDVKANTTFSGATIGNGNATAVIKLNGNTLTLSNAGATVTNTGKIISATAGTIGTGVLAVTGGTTINGGEVPNITVASVKSLTVNGVTAWGNLTSAGAVTLGGAFTLRGNYDQNVGGSLIFGANTFTSYGNWTRVSNVPNDVTYNTGTLLFTGASAQTFTSGASLILYNVTINKTNATDVVTLGQSVSITNAFTITKGKLALGDNNVRMTTIGGSFVNNGGYTSSGIGYLIFQSAGVQTISGTATFSNIDVRNNATVNSGSAINFSGNLNLRKGTFANGVNAFLMKKDLVTVPSITLYSDGVGSMTGLTVTVAAGVTYDLTYTSAGNGNVTAGSEWALAGIRNLSISTAGISTITGPTGSTSIAGALSVSLNQTLQLDNAGARTLTLAGASQTHTITGKVASAGGGSSLIVTGNANNLNGTTSTAVGSFGEVPTLMVNITTGQTFNSSNLKKINGNFVVINGTSVVTMNTATANITGNVTLTAGSLDLNMASTASAHGGNLTVTAGTMTYTRGSAAAQQNIGGTVTLTAGTLTLGSNVAATGATSQAAGNLALGTYNYTAKTASYTRTGAGTVTASTGKLIVGGITLTPGATFKVPNLELDGAVTISASMEVTNSLTHTSGAVNYSNLTFSGNTYTYVAGTITGGGPIFTGTAVVATFSGNVTFPVMTINTSGSVTIASNNTTARTITVTAFTQTLGDVNLGINSLQTNGFSRAAGNWTQGTGVLIMNAAGPTLGTGFAVDNLTILNTVNVGTAAFTVNKNLVLKNTLTTLADGKLTLGDGATVERQGNGFTLVKKPTFGSTTNLLYSTAATIITANEVPTTGLNNVTVKVNTTLGAAMTVNGTLTLTTGIFTPTVTTKELTIASGGTIVRTGGSIAIAPLVTSYNLTYNGTVVGDGNEYVAGKVANLIISPTAGNFTISKDFAASGDFTLSPTAGTQLIDLNGKNLTVAGNATITKGNFTNGSATTSKLTFSGAATQTFTVPSAGLTFPISTTTGGMELVLNNTSTAGVTLTGGNLTMANIGVANTSIIRFINGVLKTGTNVVTLWQANNGVGQPLQGFDRSGVVAGKYSHIVGNVKKFVSNSVGTAVDRSQVIFPVGTLPASPGNYRPLSIWFKTAPASSVNLTVSEADVAPGGTNGIPLNAGTFSITNYPNFYWYVKSDQTLNPSYKYDMSLQAQGYTDYVKDGIQNIRMIRRDSGNVANQWLMQGTNTSYDNSTINSSWPVLKVIDAQGGITTQGSRFTYSQNNKPPVFTAALAPVTIAEGDSVLFTYTATDPDINQTATLSSVALPTNATFDAATGAFKWVTNNLDAGTHTVTIRATDGTLNTDTTVTITVTNVNSLPTFTAAPTDTTNVAEGVTSTFQYTAADADPDNTSLTYSYIAANPHPDSVSIASATGLLTIIPKFGEAGNVYSITVRVTDSANGTTDTTVVYKVTNTDRAPVFNTAMTDTSVDENALLTLDFGPNASDPDAGDVITFTRKLYSGTTLVDTLNGAITSAGVFTWTPTYTQAGTYSLIVTASDGTLSAHDTVAVVVNNKNAAPTWVAEMQNDTVFVGDTLSFTYKTADLDNDVITYAFVGNHPTDATLNTATGDFSWAPQTATAFPVLIKVSATDGVATINTQAEITIQTITVSVAGKVTYENTNNDAIANAEVKLMQGTTVVATDSTNAAGDYSFSNVSAGNYSVMAAKTTGWPTSSILASDALLAARSSVDTTVSLTAMQKLAADVSNDGAINSFDALQILQRVVKSITSFAISDWQFAATTVTVGTSNKTVNIKGIAAGDVNESYDASAPKASIVATVESNTLKISPNAEFTLPITLDASEAVSAFTLRLSYPATKMEFKAVKSNSVQAITHVANGEISIAWADLNGKKSFMTNGKPVVLLVFKATKAFSKSEIAGLTLDQAEIVNKSGKSISSSSIKLTSAEIALPEKFELGQNYPNPFNPSTIIEYALPVKGNVKLTIFNTLGQKVVSLVSKVQEAGNYKIAFDASRLSSGVYLYNLTVEGAKNFVQTKKMILLK